MFFFFHGASVQHAKELLDDFVDDQLYFGFKEFFNTTRKDCVWRDVAKDRHLCPNEVKMVLFSNGQRETVSGYDFKIES